MNNLQDIYKTCCGCAHDEENPDIKLSPCYLCMRNVRNINNHNEDLFESESDDN